MEAAVESESDSIVAEMESTEELFEGFSPERLDLPIEIGAIVKKLESHIERIGSIAIESVELKSEDEKKEDIKPVEEPMDVPVPVVADVQESNETESEVITSQTSEDQSVKSVELDASSAISTPEPVKPPTDSTIAFMLPFYKGWRREVNFKDKEICYIHPFGARFKNIHDVSQQLTDGLSVENFTFELRSLGANPENEIIIQTVRKSGRVPVPSSNYKIAERLEEESRKRVPENNGPTSPVKRGKLVLKIKSGWAENGEKGQKKRSALSRKTSSLFRRNEKTSWTAEKVEEEPRRNCTLECPMAMGLIPSLQCSICLCLYHPECAEVGRTGLIQHNFGYVCKSCRAKPENRELPTQAATAGVPTAAAASRPISSTPVLPPLPAPVAQTQAAPQHIISLNRRRFVMVPNFLPPTATTSPTAVNPTPGPSIKQDVVEKKSTPFSTNNFMALACHSYKSLLHIFKQLSANDLGRVAQVCHYYRDLAQHPSLWEKVRLSANPGNWEAFADLLKKRRTKFLDLRNISSPSEDGLQSLLQIESLEKIYFPKISLECLKLFLREDSKLTVCYAELSDGQGDFCVSSTCLENLNIRYQNTVAMTLKTLDLTCATSLVSLSLLSFVNWQSIDFSSLKSLKKLRELAIGDCAKLPLSFCEVFAALTELESVRLEGGGTTCPLTEILESLCSHTNLRKLEMIHFDCPLGFETALARMTNLRRLLIIPLFEFQMAAKVNAILTAIYKLKENLTEMCWVFLIELLQVSELFLNRVPKGGGLDSCVPVTVPLPMPEDTSQRAAFWSDISKMKSQNNYAPVTLAKIHSMISYALVKTKTQLLVLPKASTIHMGLDDVLF